MQSSSCVSAHAGTGTSFHKHTASLSAGTGICKGSKNTTCNCVPWRTSGFQVSHAHSKHLYSLTPKLQEGEGSKIFPQDCVLNRKGVRLMREAPAISTRWSVEPCSFCFLQTQEAQTPGPQHCLCRSVECEVSVAPLLLGSCVFPLGCLNGGRWGWEQARVGWMTSLISVGTQWPLSSRISSLKHEKSGPVHLQVPQRSALLLFSLLEPMSSTAGGSGSWGLWLVFSSILHLDVTHFCWAV